MKGKFLTIIVFTLVFAVSVAIVIGSSVWNRRSDKSNTAGVTVVDDTTTAVDSDVFSETTVYDGEETKGNIYEQILNQFIGYETVFSAQNVGGHNYNKGKVDYILDGQTVTTVYETETTVNPDVTTTEPESTTIPVDTTIVDTTVTDVVTEIVTETETETVDTEVVTTDTTEASTETTEEDTTTSPESEETTVVTEETTAPVDNSQGDMISEEELM